MNLIFLSPDIQEKLLFRAPVSMGEEQIHLRDVQTLTAEMQWPAQRIGFQTLEFGVRE